jgi:hypothetical protein
MPKNESAPARVVGQRRTLDATSPASARIGSALPSASASAAPLPRS